MVETTQIEDDIWQIELDLPFEWPESLATPSQVYLLDGDFPALINGCHPAQIDQLEDVLSSFGYRFRDLQRVVYTSWRGGNLGMAPRIRKLDHFAMSPDMCRPSDYGAYIRDSRQHLQNLAETLVRQTQDRDWELDEFEESLDAFFPQSKQQIELVPLRDGHTVAASDYSFEVIEAGGPGEGHICLYDEDAGLLFTGDFALTGMPDVIGHISTYLDELEQLRDIGADLLLPNRGMHRKRPAWALGQALRFVNNFLGHAPATMYHSPTVLEFVENDRGRRIDDLTELVFEVDLFRNLLEELERTQTIETEGEGLFKRYGTDVDDPRGRVQPASG